MPSRITSKHYTWTNVQHVTFKKIGLFRPMKGPTICSAKPTFPS